MEPDNSMVSMPHATSMPQQLLVYRWLGLALLVIVLLAAGLDSVSPGGATGGGARHTPGDRQ